MSTLRPPAALAILSALPEEQRGLIDSLPNAQKTSHAGREFWCADLEGQPVVMALSRIGKVAAATTAAALIERFGVRTLVFTGVAGGIGPGVNVGDVVIGRSYVQHDMDASPLFPRYEVPLTGKRCFEADDALTTGLAASARTALADIRYRSGHPVVVHEGLIASGDRFVNASQEALTLQNNMRAQALEPLAVEMEGAAVAQVCHDYQIAFAAVRTISDRADEQASTDFTTFVREVASVYARAIIGHWLRSQSPADLT